MKFKNKDEADAAQKDAQENEKAPSSGDSKPGAEDAKSTTSPKVSPLHVCVCVYIYIYIYICTCMQDAKSTTSPKVGPFACVCVCVCVYIYIYIHVYRMPNLQCHLW